MQDISATMINDTVIALTIDPHEDTVYALEELYGPDMLDFTWEFEKLEG